MKNVEHLPQTPKDNHKQSNTSKNINVYQCQCPAHPARARLDGHWHVTLGNLRKFFLESLRKWGTWMWRAFASLWFWFYLHSLRGLGGCWCNGTFRFSCCFLFDNTFRLRSFRWCHSGRRKRRWGLFSRCRQRCCGGLASSELRD
jgi:hypothetical protein